MLTVGANSKSETEIAEKTDETKNADTLTRNNLTIVTTQTTTAFKIAQGGYRTAHCRNCEKINVC